MKNKLLFYIFLLILLSLGSIFPLFYPGFFPVHDDTAVVRVFEMSKSLAEGAFPVRWVPDLGYGYGYPIFNFYAPLPYYFGGVLNLIGFDLLNSTKIAIGFGVICSSITMFLFVRKFYGNVAGIVSATSYLYFPYHAVNIYVRGAIGEYFAYAFLPLIFLGLFSLIDLKAFKNLRGMTGTLIFIIFGTFLVAVSHNLTILMLLILLLPCIAISLFFASNKKIFLISFLTTILIGLLLASFYIIPAFLEMKYTNVASQVGGGADYKDHFVCLSQIWQSQWGFGGSIPGCVDGISFSYGKFNIALFVFSIIFGIYRIYKKKAKKQDKLFYIGVIMFFASSLLTLELSKFIWDKVKLMEYIQYPWRFTNFVGLFTSFSIGYLVWNLNRLDKKYLFLSAIICLCLILFSIKHFYPSNFNNYPEEYYKDQNYINKVVSKISDEYLPSDFVKPPDLEVPSNHFEIESNVGFVTTAEDSILEKKVSYAATADGYIHANIAYFPAWQAYTNGMRAKIIQKGDGMDVFVKKGSGEVNFIFRQTHIEILGNSISLVVFIFLFIAIMFFKSYGQKTS